MNPNDPRHGTYAGAVQHYEAHEELCGPCREAKRKYNRRSAKQLKLGRSAFTDATLLRRHLNALAAQGMSNADIARAGNSSGETVARIRKGQITRVKHDTLRRLAAVTAGPSDTLMPLEPARRRIQALAAMGYELRWIADHLDVTPQHLANWIHPYRPQVTRIHRDTHDMICALYDTHHMIPGPSARTRAIAAKRRWFAPLAWDDIDDLSEKPRLTSQSTKYDVDDVVVERILAGDVLRCTYGEKLEVMRRAEARGISKKEICSRMGWKEGRYTPRQDEAA